MLDRAFTIELSEIDLAAGLEVDSTKLNSDAQSEHWPRSYWDCQASRIAEVGSGEIDTLALDVVDALKQINQSLQASQLQVGYRTRDEVILFVRNANEMKDSFKTSEGDAVDPLDLAIVMKVLPRIAGGNNSIRRTLLGLIGIANSGTPLSFSDEPTELMENWERSGRPAAISGAKFPRTAARLCLMWERLEVEGFTSFWL